MVNAQEDGRYSIDEVVSERARFELYYPPFAAAAAAGVGSFMCSYNKLNGQHSCEHSAILSGELKGALSFSGFVVSDWDATHEHSFAAGQDIEMPAAKFINARALRDSPMSRVNDAALRILTTMFAVGVMDQPEGTWDWLRARTNVSSNASTSAARRLSAASTVLLKNSGVLPLRIDANEPPLEGNSVESGDQQHLGGRSVVGDDWRFENGTKGSTHAMAARDGVGTMVHSIAVIGFAARDRTAYGGGGSGAVHPSYISPPLDAIRDAVHGRAVRVHYDDGLWVPRAVALAAASDVAIVFVQTLSRENSDRSSLSVDDTCKTRSCVKYSPFPELLQVKQQNALVTAVAAANTRTVAILSVPGATLTPWRHKVAALLINFMPGQQVGNAIADVLFGKVAPSAKLPITLPASEHELSRFAPVRPRHGEAANYSEGLLIGYRYYDALGLEPAYPFGHGLTYTQFHYRSLSIDPVHRAVAFTLVNIGGHDGAEVAQLYVSFPAGAGEPPLVLRRFKRVALAHGQSARVVFTPLDTRTELGVWSEARHRWVNVKGTFGVHIGASSRDIRLTGRLRVDQGTEFSVDFSSLAGLRTNASELPTELDRARKCSEMQAAHSVVARASWGTLPKDGQVQWKELQCDLVVSKVLAEGTYAYRARKCKKMQATHSVVARASWGTLPKDGQAKWKELRCDRIVRKVPKPVSSTAGSLSEGDVATPAAPTLSLVHEPRSYASLPADERANGSGAFSARLPVRALGVAWGVYSKSCAAVDAFVAACIGCAPGLNTYSVALIDGQLPPAGGCASTTLSVRAADELGADVQARANTSGDPFVNNWQKVQVIFRLMLSSFQGATWLVKCDTDVLFNVPQLRARLSSKEWPHYVGKPLRLVKYHGQELIFMQGGAYALSRSAAAALLHCRFTRLDECPIQHFRHRAASAGQPLPCFDRGLSAYAEDLWTGVCMHEANLTASADPCFVTLGGTPSYARSGTPTLASLRRAADVSAHAFRARRGRCPCPVSVHPLKSNMSLWAVRQEIRC